MVAVAAKVIWPQRVDVDKQNPHKSPRIPLAPLVLSLAEREGFEPPAPCEASAFKADAFGHSAIVPPDRLASPLIVR